MCVAAVLEIAERTERKSFPAAAQDPDGDLAGRHGRAVMLVEDLVAAVGIGAIHNQGKTRGIPGGVHDGLGPGTAKVRGKPAQDGIGLRAPNRTEVEPGHSDTGQNRDDQRNEESLYQRMAGTFHHINQR